MRRRARVDANHREVVAALRAAGCSVLELQQLGSGVPDLLVGTKRVSFLVEVKAPDARGRVSSGAARSAVGQAEWADAWRGGPVFVVTSPDDALIRLGLLSPPVQPLGPPAFVVPGASSEAENP